MPDLVVSMGIDDRGVRRGLQSVESAVNRTQSRISKSGAFGDDFLRADKAVNKIGASLTGLPLKLGAVGASFYAFKQGYEYLAEFEGYLPKAERGLDRVSDAVKRFKESWALDMRAGLDGTGKVGGGLIDLASKAREYYTDYAAVVMKLAGGGGAELAAGDTPWEYRKAAEQEKKVLLAARANEQSLVRRKQLEAEIVGLKGNQLDADLKAAEARRVASMVELGRKVRDDGFGGKAMIDERNAIRARYDADVEKANRDQKKREEDEAERKAQDERKRIDEQNKRIARASEDQMQIEGDRVRSMERLAETADQKRDARESRIWLDAEERIRGYRKRLREGDLDKAGFNALRSSALSLEDTEYKASDEEYNKAVGDAERATRAKREGASIDAQELKAQTAAAMARTKEEKKVAKELELQAKFRRDEAVIRAQGLDAESERSLLEERRRLLDAEVGAVGQEGRSPRDSAGFGLDLSGAGAAASVGQAFAYSIPGKIDTTNQLIRQSNQTLREIKDKVDGAARFGP